MPHILRHSSLAGDCLSRLLSLLAAVYVMNGIASYTDHIHCYVVIIFTIISIITSSHCFNDTPYPTLVIVTTHLEIHTEGAPLGEVPVVGEMLLGVRRPGGAKGPGWHCLLDISPASLDSLEEH